MRKETPDDTPCIHRRRLLMRVTWGVGAAWAAGLSACAHDPAPPTADAQAAADGWLRQLDAGDHAATWAGAAGLFKAAVTAAAWQQAARAARGPLGALQQRRLRSARLATSLPGVPDGTYAVLLYDSRFAHKADAQETVTAVREPDGRWRVGGYFVR